MFKLSFYLKCSNQKRYCTQEYYYCDMLFNNDIVEVSGYSDIYKFKVTDT